MTNPKYGFINGVPIDHGEGWEIVPAGTIEGEYMEISSDGGKHWIKNYCSIRKTVESYEGLAFRRPIKREETNPASLPDDPNLTRQHLLTHIKASHEYIDQLKRELTTLRTAIDAAEGKLVALQNRIDSAPQVFTKQFGMLGGVDVDDCRTLIESALALIKASKEVGE